MLGAADRRRRGRFLGGGMMMDGKRIPSRAVADQGQLRPVQHLLHYCYKLRSRAFEFASTNCWRGKEQDMESAEIGCLTRRFRDERGFGLMVMNRAREKGLSIERPTKKNARFHIQNRDHNTDLRFQPSFKGITIYSIKNNAIVISWWRCYV